jgi:hypothetical protein
MAQLARLILTILILALAAPGGVQAMGNAPLLTLAAQAEAPASTDPPPAALPRTPAPPAPPARLSHILRPPRAVRHPSLRRRSPGARAPPRP